MNQCRTYDCFSGNSPENNKYKYLIQWLLFYIYSIIFDNNYGTDFNVNTYFNWNIFKNLLTSLISYYQSKNIK